MRFVKPPLIFALRSTINTESVPKVSRRKIWSVSGFMVIVNHAMTSRQLQECQHDVAVHCHVCFVLLQGRRVIPFGILSRGRFISKWQHNKTAPWQNPKRDIRPQCYLHCTAPVTSFRRNHNIIQIWHIKTFVLKDNLFVCHRPSM